MHNTDGRYAILRLAQDVLDMRGVPTSLRFITKDLQLSDNLKNPCSLERCLMACIIVNSTINMLGFRNIVSMASLNPIYSSIGERRPNCRDNDVLSQFGLD